MKRFLFLLLVIILALPASSSWAQFNDGTTFSSGPSFGNNNLALREILTLQDQNQLLKKLIERETSVNQMVDAAISVGINSPFVPAPDMALCSAVPGNIPCSQAYPSLYSNFKVATASTKQPQAPTASSMVQNTDIPALDSHVLSSLPEQPEAEVIAGQMYWMDITCLNTKCSAVVSADPKDPKARYRVMAGEKLPDGSIIRTITAVGVTIERDKKSSQLEPAPAAS